MIIQIETLSYPGVEIFAKLTETQLRNRLEPEKGIFIAESPKVIQIALDRGYTPIAILCEERHIENDAASIIAQCGNIPVYTGSRQLLESLTGYTLTRGVLCAMRRPKPLTIEEVCKDCHRVAVVDNVVNATNVGTIFRGAAALGIDAVLLGPTACDPLNRRSVRVSMGTIFQLPWTIIPGDEHGNWHIHQLQRLGFKTVALALTEKAVDIDDKELMTEERLAIIMGTEGEGLPDHLIEESDYIARIPMQNGVDSLNVAAAAAVAFWQLSYPTRVR